MDTSKEYIGMCKTAFEIQSNQSTVFGSLYYCEALQHNENCFATICSNENSCNKYVKENASNYLNNELHEFEFAFNARDNCKYWVKTWLPHQDQLQDILWSNYDDIAKQYQLATFNRFAQSVWDKTGIFNSMEQLWLAFVMGEKYNKEWVNSKWIKR